MIYFIRCGEFVKIGRANNPEARMKELKTGNPYDVELLGAFDGDDAEEGRIHIAFEQYHHRAEWFFLSNTIRSFITKACSAKPCLAQIADKSYAMHKKAFKSAARPYLVDTKTPKEDTTADAMEFKESATNTITEFLNDATEAKPSKGLRACVLYEAYLSWCEQNRKPAETYSGFRIFTGKLGIKKTRSNGIIHYRNIVLKAA